MIKRLVSIIITTVMILSLIPALSAQAEATIKIGDYIQMGKYYDEPILWRCVDIDENGPLMLADKIITIKPFDAAGNHQYADGTSQFDFNTKYNRKTNGSNLWETSNVRNWLNSTASAGNVEWIDDCPPTADKVDSGNNEYATESGFLSDGNFTQDERDSIKEVTQKSLLNSLDVAKLKTGGIANHLHNESISAVVQNYDTSFYQNLTDKMFLLDVKQVNMVYKNGTKLGASYYIGKPTQTAVSKSEFKNSISTANYYGYCLRSPYAESDNPNYVRNVNSEGIIHICDAHFSNLGVRPAFYINLSSAIFNSGNGSENDPYSAATKQIKVILNGNRLYFDVPPRIINNRTMVPLRKIFEALNAQVIWNDETKMITGKMGSTTVVLAVDSSSATVNGETKILDVPATIIDGRTLVPARFISESLGCKVDWDETTQTITIYDNPSSQITINPIIQDVQSLPVIVPSLKYDNIKIVVKNFKWQYDDVAYAWHVEVPFDFLEVERNMDNVIETFYKASAYEQLGVYNSAEIPRTIKSMIADCSNIEYGNFAAWATQPTDSTFVGHIAEDLAISASYAGYDYFQRAEFILSFVGSAIPYKITTYPRLPTQTLFDSGDCKGKSILYASILNTLGYKVALLAFRNVSGTTGHEAVGVAFEDNQVPKDRALSYFLHDGIKYYFAETTASGWTIGAESVSKPAYVYNVN